jgi:hypothetical protein
MKIDYGEKIDDPEKIVIDFLNYLEKETTLRFDMSTLSGIFAIVTCDVEELKTTISMPAEFYKLIITNFSLTMNLRFCPCENCNKIAYVELIIFGKGYEINNAIKAMDQINAIVPDIPVHIINQAGDKEYII